MSHTNTATVFLTYLSRLHLRTALLQWTSMMTAEMAAGTFAMQPQSLPITIIITDLIKHLQPSLPSPWS